MSKAKNIVAAGLTVLGNAVWWNVLANNNQLADQQNNTKMELVDVLSDSQQDESTFQIDLSLSPSDQIPQKKYEWIYAWFETNPESLNWEKIYNEDLSSIPTEVLKYWMLKKLNEIRVKNGLKPLKYDKNLEKVAQDFANDREKNWIKGLSHVDSQWRRPDDRIDDAWLLDNYVKEIYVNWTVEWIWENLSTFSWYTINTVYDAWMRSPGHKRNIVSKYVNSIWFGYTLQWNTVVCLFANVVK